MIHPDKRTGYRPAPPTGPPKLPAPPPPTTPRRQAETWPPIMTASQLARALGWDRRKLQRQGWPCTVSGRERLYVVEDVIQHLRKYRRAA